MMYPEIEELDVLFYDNEFAQFLIKVTELKPHFINFEVYEVTSWKTDEKSTPCDADLYVEGFIKWDGCSHVWFGEKEEDDSRDGYIHLCGKDSWLKHSKVMMKIYEYGADKIENYDKTVAE